MKKSELVILAMALLPCCAFAVDGVVLINQSTVVSAGGFPFVISQSGSYRLSGNLTVPNANTTAISITADNVTLDLNGFSIIGPTVCSGHPVTSCSPTGSGNGVDSTNSNITVVNGIVKGMGLAGINLRNLVGYFYVEKVQAISNGSYGIHLFGAATVSLSTANSNGNIGIASSLGNVKDNTAQYNYNDGIDAGPGTVSGNTAYSNGLYGIYVQCPASVVNNTSFNSTNNLTTISSGCAVANNAAP